ncbi:MAG: AAA family ATPase [Candidatus Paceibacterota bacterium]
MARKNKTIIALYGPAGTGKTAVAGKLCRKLSGRTARISVDIMRDMTCICLKGGWKESDEYITSAKKVVLPLTKEYLKLGYNVVIEVAPPTVFDVGKTDKWLAISLKKIGANVFLLDAPLKSVLKRNKERKGDFGQGNLSKELTKKLYNYCQKYLDKKDFIVINTEKIGADKTTVLILEKIKL